MTQIPPLLCEVDGCHHLAKTFGSARYLKTTLCLSHYFDLYKAMVKVEDAAKEVAPVRPELPALTLNKKVGEGTCKYCREPIWWRQVQPQVGQDKAKPYPAEATSTHDRGHRCHGRDRQGEL